MREKLGLAFVLEPAVGAAVGLAVGLGVGVGFVGSRVGAGVIVGDGSSPAISNEYTSIL